MDKTDGIVQRFQSLLHARGELSEPLRHDIEAQLVSEGQPRDAIEAAFFRLDEISIELMATHRVLAPELGATPGQLKQPDADLLRKVRGAAGKPSNMMALLRSHNTHWSKLVVPDLDVQGLATAIVRILKREPAVGEELLAQLDSLDGDRSEVAHSLAQMLTEADLETLSDSALATIEAATTCKPYFRGNRTETAARAYRMRVQRPALNGQPAPTDTKSILDDIAQTMIPGPLHKSEPDVEHWVSEFRILAFDGEWSERDARAATARIQRAGVSDPLANRVVARLQAEAEWVAAETRDVLPDSVQWSPNLALYVMAESPVPRYWRLKVNDIKRDNDDWWDGVDEAKIAIMMKKLLVMHPSAAEELFPRIIDSTKGILAPTLPIVTSEANDLVRALRRELGAEYRALLTKRLARRLLNRVSNRSQREWLHTVCRQ